MPTCTEEGDHLFSSGSYCGCRSRDGDAGIRANVTGDFTLSAIIIQLICALLGSNGINKPIIRGNFKHLRG